MEELESHIQKYFLAAEKGFVDAEAILSSAERPVNAIINLSQVLQATKRDSKTPSTQLYQFSGLHNKLIANLINATAREIKALQEIGEKLLEACETVKKRYGHLDKCYRDVSKHLDWRNADLNPSLPALPIILQWAHEFYLYLNSLYLQLSSAVVQISPSDSDWSSLLASLKPHAAARNKVLLIRSADLSAVRLKPQILLRSH